MTSVCSNERGAIALVIVILTFFSVLLSFALARLLQNGYDSIEFRIHSTSNALINELKSYAGAGPTFRESLQTNTVLQNCVIGDRTGTNPCVALNGTTPIEYPIILYFPQPNSAGTHDILAGAMPVGTNSGTPSRFDFYGSLCAAGSTDSHCAFQVFASFVATCPVVTEVSCARADTISVHFKVGRPPINGNMAAGFDAFSNAVSFFTEPISVAAILPPVMGSAVANVAIQAFGSSSAGQSQSTVSVQAIQPTAASVNLAFAQTGITDPNDQYLFSLLAAQDPQTALQVANALSASGITDPIVAGEMIWEEVTDPAQIKTIESVVVSTGVTQPGLIRALADLQVTDTTVANSIISRVTATGFTNDDLLFNLAMSGSTNISQMQATGAAILANPDFDGGGQDETTTAIIQAGLSNPTMISYFDNTLIGDPQTVTTISNEIQTLGITNQTIAQAIAYGQITDPATAIEMANTLTVLGLTDVASTNYAEVLASAQVTDPLIAESLLNAMIASGVTDRGYLTQAIQGGAITAAEFYAVANPTPGSPGGVSTTVAIAPTTTSLQGEPGLTVDPTTTAPASLQGLMTCTTCTASYF